MEPLKTILFLTIIIRISAEQQYGACGGTFTQSSGSISSPSYPSNYPDNQDCIYIIRAAAGYRVTLTFATFQLEPGLPSGVCNDYLQIREGDSATSPTMGTYCNTTFPAKVRSMANILWIKFHSDSSVSRAGFEATYSTGIIPQKFLLMTNSYLHAIHRMDPDTGSNFIIPIDGLSNPIAIDYDPVDGRLYWTDVIEKTIRSSNLDGSDVRLVRNLGPQANPDGLAVDSASRLILYTDTGNNIIAMIAIKSFHHRVVVNSNLEEPRAIELDKRNGVMYWSDWGATPRIERANYDGTGRKTLVSGFQYLHWPNALALDTAAERLYWADGFSDKIGWTDLEGTNVSVIAFFPGRHMFGLDLYLNELFITDWGIKIVQPATTSYIHRISVDGKAVKTIGSVAGRLNDIHIYSEETSRVEPNGCGNNNGGCDYICIPVPGNTSQCLYPDGISIVVTTKDITTPTTTVNRPTTTTNRPTTTTNRPTTTSNRPTTTVNRPTTTTNRPTTTTNRPTTTSNRPTTTVNRPTTTTNRPTTTTNRHTTTTTRPTTTTTTPIIIARGQTTTATRPTTTANRPTSDVSTVLTSISRVPLVPDDVHTAAIGVHDVMSGVTNLSGDSNANQGSKDLGISLQLIILVVGCVVVIITIVSCVTIIIIVKKKTRDNSLRFLRQRSNERTMSGTSTTDSSKMDQVTQKTYFYCQTSENIYDEPLIVMDIGPTEGFPHSAGLNTPVTDVFHSPSAHQEPLTPGQDNGGYLQPISFKPLKTNEWQSF